jgi:hypothetical protein
MQKSGKADDAAGLAGKELADGHTLKEGTEFKPGGSFTR